MLIECNSDQWHLEAVTTEKYWSEIFRSIPNRNFLTAPWAGMINKEIVSEFSCEHIEDGITVCQHIRYREIIPLLARAGVKLLFTPHASLEQGDMHVLPIAHFPVNGALPAPDKGIFYSFVGTPKSHPIREEILKMQHPQDCVMISRSEWHFMRALQELYGTAPTTSKEEEEQAALEYKSLLSRSRFSLCPRGTGASTVRFWESLQAGAIPVVIADDMMLPSSADVEWDECIVRLPEKSLPSLVTVLSAIPARKEEEMRRNCLEACRIFLQRAWLEDCVNRFFER